MRQGLEAFQSVCGVARAIGGCATVPQDARHYFDSSGDDLGGGELHKRYKPPVVLEEQTSDNLRLNVSAPTQELDSESWESFGSDLRDLALRTAVNSLLKQHTAESGLQRHGVFSRK